MSRSFSLSILLFFVSFSVSAQKKSNTETYIINLSKTKFSYMHPDSLSKLKPLLDERLVYIHSSGSTESKTDLLENIKNGKWMLRKVDVKKPSVRIFKSDLAVLVAEGHFYVTGANGSNSEMDLLYTEVWAKYKDGWKLLSRHANKLTN